MAMRLNTLKYLFKEGIMGIWKNRLMAFASAGTIVLCLLILGISYSIGSNINFVLHQLETKFGISAYISDKATDERINEIKTQIQQIPHVVEIVYISKEEALDFFTEDAEEDSIYKRFQDDNPLPASFEIHISSITYQEQVVEALREIPELEVDYFKNEAQIFVKINDAINLVSTLVIIFLIIVGILLMANTIKLTVYVRRKEINIMKYIGATDAFIRLPFVIEGVVVGCIGSSVAIGAVWLLYNWGEEALVNILNAFLAEIALKPAPQMIQSFIPMALGIGISIGIIGSIAAIRKHLKV